MKFSPQEITRLVEYRARYFLITQQYLERPDDFDAAVIALRQLQAVNAEWFILLAPYLEKIQNDAFPENSRMKIFKLFSGAHKIKDVIKEVNAIMFDENTREAFKTIFTGSPVTGLSAPVSVNKNLKVGGEHCVTIDGQRYAGIVTTKMTTDFIITFADHSTLQWQPSDDGSISDVIRQQFNDKIRSLSDNQRLRVAKM